MFEADNLETSLYLTIKAGGELLALDVSKVREILDLCPVTRVPRTQVYMKGVINLRGSIVPVMDLRLRFGMKPVESTIDTRIVVIELELDGVDTIVSFLTDSVHEVIGIGDDNISPSPETGAYWRTQYINGIGRYGDDFVLLLDMGKVFSEQEKAYVSV